MIKIGITGGIGSGKSTITEILSVLGIPVYIADVESKKLIDSSPIIKKELINLFGKNIYKDGFLDRKLLASYIFSNKENLYLVNSIIHPEVKNNFSEWCVFNNEYSIVAVESAILFESDFHVLVDKTMTIYAPLDIRIERTIRRDNTTREKVLERIENQMSDEEKIKRSDFIINNDDRHSLIEQVLEILKKINTGG